MQFKIKRTLVALSLMILLVFSFAEMKFCFAEFSARDEALSVSADVVGLDTSKYDSSLVNDFWEYPPEWGGMGYETVTYAFDNNESSLGVKFRFVNDTLSSCTLSLYEGSPIFLQSYANTLGSAKGFLQRYQNNSDANYLESMIDMLDQIETMENLTSTSDNLKFQITITESREEFNWIYTSNDIDFPGKGVSLSFRDGIFRSFSDGWWLTKIGNDTLGVDKEEAITIAREIAKNLTWKLYTSNDTWVEVKDALADEPVLAEVVTGTIREPFTLYPCWMVHLYFDQIYLGNIYGIRFSIAADTGEVIYYEAKFFLGGTPEPENPPADPPSSGSSSSTVPRTENPSTAPPELPPDDPSVQPKDSTVKPTDTTTERSSDVSTDQTNLNLLMFLAGVAIILATVLGTRFYKKRRKTSGH